MNIRRSTEQERPAIDDLHRSAFGEIQGPEIVDLLDALFRDPSARPILSLVAAEGERLTGHVLFSHLEIFSPEKPAPAARLLAPLAVRAEAQRSGVGSTLVRNGLLRLQAERVALVFVLGNPAFYGRFGFAPALPKGFVPPHELPPAYLDAWMVAELLPGTSSASGGPVRCADSISDRRYWRE